MVYNGKHTWVPTFLTEFTFGALPASPDYCVTFYLKLQTVAVIMLTT